MPRRRSEPALTGPTLRVLLEEWVLNEGNHSTFRAGRTKRFALGVEVDLTRPVRVDHGASRGLRPLDEAARYEITADVMAHVSAGEGNHAVALDLGVRAFYRGADPWMVGLSVGDRVVLTADLVVDAYDYVEFLAPRTTIPALVHTWQVDDVAVDRPPGTRDGWCTVGRTAYESAGPDVYDTTYLITCTATGAEPARAI